MNKVDPIRELVINKVNDFLKEKITSEELEKIFFYSSIDYTLHTLSISRRLLEKEKINKIVKLMPSIQREKERNTYLKNNNHLDVLLLIYNLTKVIKSWFFENYLPKNLDINKSLELLNLKIDNFRIRGKLDIIKDESEIIENLNQLFNKNGLIFKIVEDYNIFKKSVITKGRSDFFLIWIKNMFFEEIIEKLRHLKIKVYSKPNLIGEHTLIEILKKGVHKNSYENLINLLDENIKLQKKIEEKTIKFKKIFTNLAKNIKEKNVEIDMISDDYEAIVKQNCYDFKLNSWILNESDLTIIGIGCNIINNGYSIINNTSEKTLDLKNIEKAKEAALQFNQIINKLLELEINLLEYYEQEVLKSFEEIVGIEQGRNAKLKENEYSRINNTNINIKNNRRLVNIWWIIFIIPMIILSFFSITLLKKKNEEILKLKNM